MEKLIELAKNGLIDTLNKEYNDLGVIELKFRRAELCYYSSNNDNNIRGCKLLFYFDVIEDGVSGWYRSFDFGTIGFKTPKGWLSSKKVLVDIKNSENLTPEEIQQIIPYLLDDVKIFTKYYPSNSNNDFGAWAQVFAQYTPFAEIGSGTYTACNKDEHGNIKATSY